MPIVKGPFEVNLTPLTPYEDAPDARFGRRSIDKRFHGALEAVSKGEMLSAGGTVQGSAAYVAIEYVRGTLDGRSGAFALVHRATLDRGTPELRITVVPDSASGELTGLRGEMRIEITAGAHAYEFEYEVAAS